MRTAIATTLLPEMLIRSGVRGDLTTLLDIENSCFETDRLSRRSLLSLLNSNTAILLVAEAEQSVIGYALILFRQGTAMARLYSIAVLAQHTGKQVATSLLNAAEQASIDAEKAILRLEVADDNLRAVALYQKSGYVKIRHLEHYYGQGKHGCRMEKPLRKGGHAPPGIPYYAQTTDFTCGPSCLLMAMQYFDPDTAIDPVSEVRLWREATTIFMGTGLGGCEPYGMATALAERDFNVELHLSENGPLLLQTVNNAEKKRVMKIAQQDFRNRVEALGITVGGALVAADLAPYLDGSTVAICLISGNRMFGKRVPHWVIAHSAQQRYIYIHDPWVDPTQFESVMSATNIPIPFAEFDRMSRYGKSGLRASLLIRGKRG